MSRFFMMLFLSAVFAMLLPGLVFSAVVTTGDIDPTTDPTTWGSRTGAYIGKTADGTMAIDGGSEVENGTVYLGYGPGVFGEVTVDGTNSLWENSYLYIGDEGSGKLSITNGGVVNSYRNFLGNESGSSGEVTVDGTNSVWNSSESSSFIGYRGTGTMRITNGGTVNSTGWYSLGNSSGSYGEVLVDGANSAWNHDDILKVGILGQGVLTISNGGVVQNKSVQIGGPRTVIPPEEEPLPTQDGPGVVTVDGVDSSWLVDAEESSKIYVGGDGTGTLNITNGATVQASNTYVDRDNGNIHFGDNGGSLTTTNLHVLPRHLTGTGTINTHGLVSDIDLVFDAANPAIQTFTHSDASHDITFNLNMDGTYPRGDLGIGCEGNATMAIRDGVTIGTRFSYLGYYAGSSGVVTVDGADSTWASSSLDVGYEGSGLLTVSNGGVVNSFLRIAYASGSTGEVVVDGGSLSGGANVGYGGNGKLKILNGGTVESRDLRIAYESNSVGEVTVDGNGSSLSVPRAFYIGQSGDATLNITDGALLNSGMDTEYADQYPAYIGSASWASGTVNVSGPNSQWNCYDKLDVGRYGDGTLNITDGGVVNCRYGCLVGLESNSSGVVTVDGAGSMLTSDEGSFYVGIGLNSNGTLTVTNGAVITSSAGSLGGSSDSIGIITIDGPGSIWNNSGSLTIGSSGHGILNVTNGGFVSSSIGHMGKMGPSGKVTVSGNSSTWENSGKLQAKGALSILDGGSVSNLDANFTNGNITVDGTNSIWDNSGALSIDTGTLKISNGGVVNNTEGTFGHVLITVEGADSKWNNSGNLYIAKANSGIFNVTDGGKVYSATGYLAHDKNTSCTATIDGANSEWNNSSDLFVGRNGNATLNITNGATVNNAYGYIGFSNLSTSTVTVDGTGSTWINQKDLKVGNGGNGSLFITNDATVLAKNTTVAVYRTATGLIDFGTNGGTLTTGNLYVSSDQLAGTGTINAQGLVSDLDLVFDATHGANQVLHFNGTGQNVALNLLLSETGSLGVGYKNSASMMIRDGVTISSYDGYLGYTRTDSASEATVEGPGSTWNNSNKLYVGHEGNAILNIVNGGTVNSVNAYLSYEYNVSGTATVDGTGSIWNNSDTLEVGRYYTGTMNVINGGTVNSTNAYLGSNHPSSYGEATVDGAGSTWNSDVLKVGKNGRGTLNILNDGLVRVEAGLIIDEDGDNDSFINMTTGGMLALLGEASDSLNAFLDLTDGTDAIRWWDDSIGTEGDWALLITATYWKNYKLEYLTDGDLAGYTVLTVETLVPGDANGDGKVDGSDVTILANNWQHGVDMAEPDATWKIGDFNGDGRVDGSDVTILANNWQYGVTPIVTAVPEPSTMVLLFLLLAVGLVPTLKRHG